MLDKLDTTIEELIRENRVKTKWSEIENYGISEVVNRIFEDSPYSEDVASMPIIEDRVVCLNLFGGIIHEIGGEIYTFIRVYIDIDNNIVFLTTNGKVFLYETDIIDAEDPRHYYEGE